MNEGVRKALDLKRKDNKSVHFDRFVFPKLGVFAVEVNFFGWIGIIGGLSFNCCVGTEPAGKEDAFGYISYW